MKLNFRSVQVIFPLLHVFFLLLFHCLRYTRWLHRDLATVNRFNFTNSWLNGSQNKNDSTIGIKWKDSDFDGVSCFVLCELPLDWWFVDVFVWLVILLSCFVCVVYLLFTKSKNKHDGKRVEQINEWKSVDLKSSEMGFGAWPVSFCVHCRQHQSNVVFAHSTTKTWSNDKCRMFCLCALVRYFFFRHRLNNDYYYWNFIFSSLRNGIENAKKGMKEVKSRLKKSNTQLWARFKVCFVPCCCSTHGLFQFDSMYSVCALCFVCSSSKLSRLKQLKYMRFVYECQANSSVRVEKRNGNDHNQCRVDMPSRQWCTMSRHVTTTHKLA